MSGELAYADIRRWLCDSDEQRLRELWREADEVRRANVGQAVHLRGLVEISNHCARQCAYCGLRMGNSSLPRYRMSAAEILACTRQAVEFGYGTVVLQAGEDEGITAGWMASVVRQIKSETKLAVTLSLGERAPEELSLWKSAGADRYLLRFETSDFALFRRIHPPLPGKSCDRVRLLRYLRQLGYEIGSGIMVGIPGQTFDTLARDICLFRELDLDMIGIGPYIPSPSTPLGRSLDQHQAKADQVPPVEVMVYKAVALARLVCPQANIPSTTALATINKRNGRELGLQRGANVLMPNLTPMAYRKLYQIYPAKACIDETSEACHGCLRARIVGMGRQVGRGPGGRVSNHSKRCVATASSPCL